MKKILSLIILTLTCSVAVNAVPRSAEEALEIAKRFVGSTSMFSHNKSAQLTLSQSIHADSKLRGNLDGESTPAYYICNINDADGFVVVSGDDRFKEVLGYATSGNINNENLPEGLQYWLGFLAREMQAAQAYYDANGIVRTSDVSDESYNALVSVEPLIKTKWSQDAPFNNLCPMTSEGRAVTGCVATGMAQVMKYHGAPLKGIGSHTNAYFAGCTADFGNTTYDWANMRNEYGVTATEAQKNAVATLMYHCGVATDMRYTAHDSGTPSIYAGMALVNYFGYNPNMHYEGRDYMSAGAWKALLLSELQANRPLVYWGMTSETSGAGHFFVCDGYDAGSGLFHFNWGWGGTFDGYYELSALEPGIGGAGAGTGEFNYFQSILVGLQPEAMGEYESHFEMKSFAPAKTTMNQGQWMEFNITELTNNAINFNGKIGFAVFKDGALFKTLEMSSVPSTLPLGAYYSTYSMSCKFDSSFPAGTYQICLIAQNEGQENFDVIRAYHGNTTVWNAEVTSDYKVKFTPATADAPNITGDIELPETQAKHTVYNNKFATFTLNVTNSSASEFFDEIGVCIRKGRVGEKLYFTAPVRIAPGETKEITVGGTVTLAEGDYIVSGCYRDGESFINFDNTQDLTIEPEANSINGIENQKEVKSVELYSIAGARIASQHKGLAIRKTTFTDGTVKTEKTINK